MCILRYHTVKFEIINHPCFIIFCQHEAIFHKHPGHHVYQQNKQTNKQLKSIQTQLR